MTGWRSNGLEDDVSPRMFQAARRGEAFALATITFADGGPRPEGSQMVVTERDSWGFLSGGCIEEDVARNARLVLHDGQPLRLVYGRGSPFIDIRLPCGGQLEVLIERVLPGDPAVRRLETLTSQRRPALWCSDGLARHCEELLEDTAVPAVAIRRYEPWPRLIVIGSDAFALALAGLGVTVGWEVRLLAPFGPKGGAPFGVACDRRALAVSLRPEDLDRWTAVAVATHDLEADETALATALASPAGYVGVLGSRRKLGQRQARLAALGLTAAQIGRLRAPIGLDIGAQSPWELGVSVVGEIIAETRRSAPSTFAFESAACVLA